MPQETPREAFMHDVDTGPEVNPVELRALIQAAPDSVIVRGVLQMLRANAATLNRDCQNIRATADERTHAAGGAAALEDAFWNVVSWKLTPVEG